MTSVGPRFTHMFTQEIKNGSLFEEVNIHGGLNREIPSFPFSGLMRQVVRSRITTILVITLVLVSIDRPAPKTKIVFATRSGKFWI